MILGFEVLANEREHDPVQLFPVNLAPSAQESFPPEAGVLRDLLGRFVPGAEAKAGQRYRRIGEVQP